MDNINMNKLKRMIIVSSIIIVLVIIIMLVINLSRKREEIKKEEDILDQGNIAPTFSYEKEVVKNHSMFFSVESAIQTYLNSIYLNIEEISIEAVKGSSMRSATAIYAENHNITDEQSKKQVIYNFLDEQYIKKNDITVENVLEKIENDGDVEFRALEMFQVQGEHINQFSVFGQELKENKFKNVYFVINVDNQNNTFSIIPIEKEQYQTLEEVPLNSEDKSIDKKDSNYFNFQIMQDMDIAQKYFTYYKKLMLENSPKAYEHLDEEYRNKRFGSLEGFQKYIDDNREEIKNYLAKEYTLNNYTDSVEYVCLDKYKNQYLFNVSSVMNFTVKLDTYTIESDEVKEEYIRAKDLKKVKMNVDKWILMLNNRDYKSAFEVLDEDFRNQYFQTVEKFEQYMRNIFPLHYGLTFSDCTQEGGVFVQKILLTDIISNDKTVIPETIIMKLTDEGFVMSFRILNH